MKMLTAILILVSLSIVVKGMMNRGFFDFQSIQAAPAVDSLKQTKPALFSSQEQSNADKALALDVMADNIAVR